MTQAAILAASGSPGTTTGFKNRIINGGMVIDQRNAGASVTATTNNEFTLDRWQQKSSVSSKFTVQQNAGSVTPPAGFSNYLGVTSSSAYSSGSSDYFFLSYNIEGFNTADLNYGTANAKTVTLSFWVYSSLTGTFGGSFRNSAANYSYPYTYTISSANTWEYKTITVAGPTSGTWIGATNGIGLNVNFNLGTGTTYSGTAGSWAATNYVSATGATAVTGTSGATFYITGVQLEVGTTATNFDFRSYGQELLLCQRYYQRYAGDGNGSTPVSTGSVWSSTAFFADIQHKVKFRAAPSATTSTTTCVLIYVNGSASACTNINITNMNTDTSEVVANQTGMTVAQAGFMRLNAASDWIGLSAEL